MKNNVQKARELGILKDLLENHTEQQINYMSAKQILDAWLNWEGIIGHTNNIDQIINTFYPIEKPNCINKNY